MIDSTRADPAEVQLQTRIMLEAHGRDSVPTHYMYVGLAP